MTKTELLEAIKDVPDSAVIRIEDREYYELDAKTVIIEANAIVITTN